MHFPVFAPGTKLLFLGLSAAAIRKISELIKYSPKVVVLVNTGGLFNYYYLSDEFKYIFEH